MLWICIIVAALASGVVGVIVLAVRGGLGAERVPAARRAGDSMRAVLSVDLRGRDAERE